MMRPLLFHVFSSLLCLLMLVGGILPSFSQGELQPKLEAVTDTAAPFINQAGIDANRYREVKGSPYIFENWGKGTVYDAIGNMYRNIYVNYNGYERMFEAKQGDTIVALTNTSFLRVELPGSMDKEFSEELAEDTIIFQNRLHPKFGAEFIQVLHDGRRVKLLREYYKDLSKHTVQNVGKAVDFQRFTPRELLHLYVNGNLSLVKFKKSAFLEKLGKEEELEQFIKEEGLKFKSLADFQKLLTHYETLL